MVKRVKRQPRLRKRIFAHHISDKDLISRLCEELLQLNSSKSHLSKKGADVNQHCSKEDIQMANMCMKKCSSSPIIRETQIKTIVRYQHMFTRMVAIQKKKKTVTSEARMWRNWSPCTRWWECGWCSCYRKQFGGSWKKQKQNFHMTQHFCFWVYTKKELKTRSQMIFVYPCSQQHYSKWPKGESNPLSIYGWMEKQNAVYRYNGISLSLKKEILTHATTWMNPAS